MILNKKITNFIAFFLILILASCAKIPKPDFSKKPVLEPNAKKRARQNVIEGRGFSFGSKNNSGGDFLFASSNPMWRASLDIIDFMSLSTVDYAGGLIITDWYSEENSNESIKITIKFLSNEIRADGLKINFHKKTCSQNFSCVVKKLDTDLDIQMKDKILRKAVVYQKELNTKKKKNLPEKKWKGDND